LSQYLSVTFVARPAGKLKGKIRVPGDKSISHRSIMFGSLAEGVTHVTGFLEGGDSLGTLQAFRDMGVKIEGPVDGKVTVYGVGLHGLKKPAKEIDLGNSGTSMRLMAGILSGQSFDSTLIGDNSLSKRPMGRVITPLTQMGARIDSRDGKPPLLIHGVQKLKAIHYDMPMASAQVKSCILLAGLYAEGLSSVTEPEVTRDHSERMLRAYGYDVKTNKDSSGKTVISLRGGGKLKAADIDVPADISSAAFFLVAASITPGSDITLTHVCVNPTRTGVVDILKLMGANIELLNQRELGGEPVADLRVRASDLHGINIPAHLVPLAIDEFPVLFVAAACAKGKTILTGAEELRVKESDRIQVMADGLKTLGISATPTPDGIIIEGGKMGSGTVESHDDHRISMSFSVASLRASGAIRINNCNNVATSFPNFVELAKLLGFNIEVLHTEQKS
jgi:cyclohexadieny/prephenate dehydrogenase / 3-phosphoshikimate 1-carboxyvinyltransferase